MNVNTKVRCCITACRDAWFVQRRHLALAASSTSTAVEVSDPLLLYRSLVLRGQIREDAEQLRALYQMRKLHAELLDYQPPVRLITLLEALRSSSDPMETGSVPPWPFERSNLSTAKQRGLSPEEEGERQQILALGEKAMSRALVQVLKEEHALENLPSPKGFLLTGPPGTGKSMLLDIFFASLPVKKVRFHYHHFLLSLYGKIHEALEKQRAEFEAEERLMNAASESGVGGYSWSRREEMKALAISKGWRSVFAGGRSPNDPDLNVQEFVLVGIARDLMKTHGWLLAFDEVQLVDIAGAGMLSRVLSWYWRLGGVVIGSSNRVPEDLYKSGVQRQTLNTFLIALAARSPVIEVASPLDYRRESRSTLPLPSCDTTPGDVGTLNTWRRWGSDAKAWFIKGQEEQFNSAVERITGGAKGEPDSLKVYGRNVTIPWVSKGVARFSFSDLCERALGPADYITIASHFHTVILSNIPTLPLNAKNEARRLITLLDSLYETKTRLLALAETDIDSLFFPDAPSAENPSSSNAPFPQIVASPDDVSVPRSDTHSQSSTRITEGDSSTVQPHSVFRHAVDPAGEVSDSLTEEMIGDVLQDLEAPYRPNISYYDATAASKLYDDDAARVEQDKGRKDGRDNENKRKKDRSSDPHPSASTPSFQSLAIFTGEEERFAFKRAVSRVHEMSSPEYLSTAVWSPLDPSFRTWERSASTSTSGTDKAADRVATTVSPRHKMGEAVALGREKLSGAVTPHEIRHKFPNGLPEHPMVDVGSHRTKFDVTGLEKEQDPRTVTKPPKLKDDHVWGVREDWGEKAGKWGKGALAYEESEKK